MTPEGADVGGCPTELTVDGRAATLYIPASKRGTPVDIRTLIVDDDQDSCDFIERILKNEGYRVGSLTDPRKVEDELRKNDVHLAIVDLKMPDLSGLDVAQIIKKYDSDCSVILMTGYATLDSAVGALRYGVVDYLKKPVREDSERMLVGVALEDTKAFQNTLNKLQLHNRIELVRYAFEHGLTGEPEP